LDFSSTRKPQKPILAQICTTSSSSSSAAAGASQQRKHNSLRRSSSSRVVKSPTLSTHFCLPDDTKDEESKAHVMLDKEESKARVMLDTRKNRRFLNPQKQRQQQQ
jgi:hypothetical protein